VFALRHGLQPSFLFARYASATPAIASHWTFVSLPGLHSSHYGTARSAERITFAFSRMRIMHAPHVGAPGKLLHIVIALAPEIGLHDVKHHSTMTPSF